MVWVFNGARIVHGRDTFQVLLLGLLLSLLFSSAGCFAPLLKVPVRSRGIQGVPSLRVGVQHSLRHVQPHDARTEVAMVELPQLILSQSSAVAVPPQLMLIGSLGAVATGIFALYSLVNAVFVQPNLQLLLVKLDGLAEDNKKLAEDNKKLDEKLDRVKGELKAEFKSGLDGLTSKSTIGPLEGVIRTQ
uniref:Uncharacterized protein n=1 Tax=Hemiselmis tepida TaxID=464990 RepID=A0A6T6VB16_9CRYP|mmetsp:Transcript_30719/g.77713  ORF Transcript_30719/g.77713 Transcript_30719/m.77713 type:complete len:189 (+) Transcript_30719:560-1126(+)